MREGRAARLINQRALDPALPGLETVIDRLVTATSARQTRSAYEAEIARATQYVLVDRLMTLAGDAPLRRQAPRPAPGELLTSMRPPCWVTMP